MKSADFHLLGKSNAPPLEDNRHCFACGADNPDGLQLKFEYSDDSARCVYVPPPKFGGWRNIVHGGIVATLLDESMAHAAIAAGVRAVTARIEVRFRNAVPVAGSLVATGRLEGRRGRILELSGTVAGEDGVVYADAKARFLAVGEATPAATREKRGPRTGA